VLTEVTTSSPEREVQSRADLAAQRAEVAHLGRLIPLLEVAHLSLHAQNPHIATPDYGNRCSRWPSEPSATEDRLRSRLSAVDGGSAAVIEQPGNADLTGLTTLVGIADTRVAQTARGLMGLIGEALNDAGGEEFDEFDEESSKEDVESEKILADPQLSTPLLALSLALGMLEC
jgi:hypothetical protein